MAAGPGCGDGDQDASTTTSPTGGGGEGGTGGTGGTGGMGGGGGAGGAGGGAAESGVSATETVSAGEVSKSPNYTMVFTFGQPTQNQGKTTSPSYRMQGGLVGANGSAQ
ncbi:MAG: hypothetical protein HUU21_26045 [Polyangiaceae bacterium]|nr:hypothetical protein [Polyangiaceae bacterium]